MNNSPNTDAIMRDLEQMRDDPERLLAACRIALSMAEYDLRKMRAALEQITVLAEFGTTGPRTVPPCKSDALNAEQATALRGSISEIARKARGE